MAKTAAGVPVLTIPLDPAAPVPMFRQLYDGLRAAILAGRLAPGTRLPATRTLATEHGVSRTTVLTAFDMLTAEGYVDGRVGAGTFVTRSLPDERMRARAGHPPPGRPVPAGRLSRRGEATAGAVPLVDQGFGPPRPFRPGTPAVDAFPLEVWAALERRRSSAHLLGYGDPAGYVPLREAVATHLSTTRAVRCTAGQVVIVSGTQQALDLAARLLLDPGDRAWVEDPGYPAAKAALRAAGAEVVPVPVDAAGLDVAAGERLAPAARLAYVTPSHQYPTGAVMPLARRLALLGWAARAGAWVLEDDYDSEYRYAGRPLASLQGLDGGGRVAYLGTFSKVLFPALRLGYLVLPEGAAGRFAAALAVAAGPAPTRPQAVLADFIAEGHFARHLRRMRTLYADRQEVFLKAARRELGGRLEVAPADTGLHVVGWLPEGRDDRAASERAAAAGVEAPALSAYAERPALRGGLVLGYAAARPGRTYEAVRRLAGALA